MRDSLDASHVALDDAKDRLLDYAAALAARDAAAPPLPALCFVGPPGVGKTSLARAFAAALGRPLARVSPHAWGPALPNGMPGALVEAVRAAGAPGPVVLVEHVDRLAADMRAAAAALGDALDPAERGGGGGAFRGAAGSSPCDLSAALFILTSHTPAGVPEPLRDHAEVVRFPGYADGEKRAIAERHLVPRQLRACGLDADAFRAEPGVLDAIVRGWTREAGVRELERRVGRIARRLARRRSERGGESDADAGVVRVAALADWLGPRPFGDDAPSGDDAVGVATGLAHTAAGGEVIQVEVTALPGRGRVQLTGALGEVMRESAGAAIGCVRARAESLGVDPDFPRTRDLHVHVPTAGTPKEGPSAGLAFAAALVSALTGVPLRGDVAMTGEITLRGRVLYVGGVREKAAAAARHRIAHVVLPRACADALGALPRALGDGVCWHPVASLDEALAVALRRRVT